MQKSLLLPLYDPSKSKQKSLRQTYTEFLNLICEHRAVSSRAKTDNELHHITYKEMRKKYNGTSSQMIEEARRIAWRTRKQGHPKKCAVRFDKRLFSLSTTKRENPILSIRLARKRIGIPVILYSRIKKHIEDGWNPTSLILTSKLKFYVVVSRERISVQKTKNVLGVDVNASKIAISVITPKKILRQIYLGKHISSRQYEFEKRRALLQDYRNTLTSSKAGIKLKKLSGRQLRYVHTNIWMLASSIVKLAKKYNACISIEALKHMRRTRNQLSKKLRRKINRIPYGLLKHCLRSICHMEGIPLVLINPKHTSQQCQKCHHISKKNWIDYKLFRCEICGFECDRDRNASVNIAVRASCFLHNKQNLSAQISDGDADINRHDLKDEGSVKNTECVGCPSFRPLNLLGGS